MGLLTFSLGGIHPPENKLSKGMSIQNIDLPKQVVVPMTQNLGAPSLWPYLPSHLRME